MVRKHLLRIPIDCLRMQEAVTRICTMLLQSDKQHIITTVNPEFIVDAHHDSTFREVLRSSDLSLPDGIGVQLAVGAPERLSGIDVLERFFSSSLSHKQLAAARGLQGLTLRVFLLGGRHSVAARAARLLKEQYSHVTIVGTYEGEGDQHADEETRKKILSQAQDGKIDLLLVAFGHGKQEKWIARNLAYLPVKVAMGVGGAFDYLCGRVPRAPKWMRNIGVEWLFRLVAQPWRIKRQWKLLYFIWLVLFDRAVSCARGGGRYTEPGG